MNIEISQSFFRTAWTDVKFKDGKVVIWIKDSNDQEHKFSFEEVKVESFD